MDYATYIGELIESHKKNTNISYEITIKNGVDVFNENIAHFRKINIKLDDSNYVSITIPDTEITNSRLKMIFNKYNLTNEFDNEIIFDKLVRSYCVFYTPNITTGNKIFSLIDEIAHLRFYIETVYFRYKDKYIINLNNKIIISYGASYEDIKIWFDFVDTLDKNNIIYRKQSTDKIRYLRNRFEVLSQYYDSWVYEREHYSTDSSSDIVNIYIKRFVFENPIYNTKYNNIGDIIIGNKY